MKTSTLRLSGDTQRNLIISTAWKLNWTRKQTNAVLRDAGLKPVLEEDGYYPSWYEPTEPFEKEYSRKNKGVKNNA